MFANMLRYFCIKEMNKINLNIPFEYNEILGNISSSKLFQNVYFILKQHDINIIQSLYNITYFDTLLL